MGRANHSPCFSAGRLPAHNCISQPCRISHVVLVQLHCEHGQLISSKPCCLQPSWGGGVLFESVLGVPERSLAYVTHQLQSQPSPVGITSQLGCDNCGQLIS